MGEMSFGVGINSADVWANPSLFDIEWSLGTPPLAHFDTTKDAELWGQNWGLPPYRWENHRSTAFAWLRGRIAYEKEFFHGCRIDHLRGYFRAYMFPWAGGAKHVEFSHLTEEEALLKTGGLLPRFVPGPDGDPVAAVMNELQGREIISGSSSMPQARWTSWPRSWARCRITWRVAWMTSSSPISASRN